MRQRNPEPLFGALTDDLGLGNGGFLCIAKRSCVGQCEAEGTATIVLLLAFLISI